MLWPSLQEQDTNIQENIKPDEMCCSMLRYFASGESYRSLEYQFRISRKAISCITDEVAQATAEILGKEFLKTPETTKEWEETKNYPKRIGAVDGKHIAIQ